MTGKKFRKDRKKKHETEDIRIQQDNLSSFKNYLYDNSAQVSSTQAKAEFLAEITTLVVIYASGKALHNITFVLRNITENDRGGGTKKLGDSFTCSLFKAIFMGCLPNRSGFWLVESFFHGQRPP